MSTPHPDEQILQSEVEQAAPGPEIYDRLARSLPEHEALFDFLAMREEHARRIFAIHAERAWLRHFGWRIIRPFVLVVVVAGVFFAFFQRAIDPTLGAMVFVGGAAALYLVTQVFAMFWAQRNQKRLPGLEADYRARALRRLEQLRRERGEAS